MVLLTALFIAGCGDGGATAPVERNRVPAVADAIPDRTVQIGETATVDVAAHFTDPDGDALTYAASSSRTSVATAGVSGRTVTVAGVAEGAATIRITATDPGGLSAVQTFGVTVVPPGALPEPLLDSLVVAFTDEHGIGAAAIGMMKDGVIVYNKVFGWKDRERTVPLPEDAMMRLASVTKPFTAAAIHELAREGALDLDAFVFDLGRSGGGLLDIEPFPYLGDARLAEITVRHLLGHRGGWDRDIAGDLTFREIRIAEAMSVSSPPGRYHTVRYILGQSLQFDPGSERKYSNIGYLVLGLVIEEVSGRDYLSLLFEKVLSPLGVHGDDVILGRTFPRDRSDREPWYDNGGRLSPNVFDPDGPRVPWPDGGWHHEAHVAQGGLVASTEPILKFLDVYRVYSRGDNIGTRRQRPEPTGWRWVHEGGLPGTSTAARQRWDGVNYVVLFNKRGPQNYAREIAGIIDEILNNTRIAWP